MKFISSIDSVKGAHDLAQKIATELHDGKHLLWLMPGGSNVPISKAVMDELRHTVNPKNLFQLTVSQTDERYGPVGHPDSNWKQLLDLGFDTSGITAIPILADLSLEETVSHWAEKIVPVFETSDVIIGQFGLGVDGHIAGMLPHSPTVTETAPTSGYVSEPFTRLSLTPPMLRQINAAYVFAFGESKKEAISHLHDPNISLANHPLQILLEIPEVYLYSDQV